MLAAVADLFSRDEVDDQHLYEVYGELVIFRRERITGDLYTPRAFERLVRAAGMMVAAGA
jgi:hypothetical protein